MAKHLTKSCPIWSSSATTRINQIISSHGDARREHHTRYPSLSAVENPTPLRFHVSFIDTLMHRLKDAHRLVNPDVVHKLVPAKVVQPMLPVSVTCSGPFSSRRPSRLEAPGLQSTYRTALRRFSSSAIVDPLRQSTRRVRCLPAIDPYSPRLVFIASRWRS